jgi:hypothetical protein
VEPTVEVVEGLNPLTRQPETWVRLTYPSGNVWNLTMSTAREIDAAIFRYDLAQHWLEQGA